MSSAARPDGPEPSPAEPGRSPIGLPRIREMHARGEPIVMITAYDHPSALAAEEAGVDIVLVGDSAANCVLGHESTTAIGLDEMLMLSAAVRRGLRTPFLIGDLPFGSYEGSNEEAIRSAQRFIREGGCDAVKLERGGGSAERAAAIVRAGIPVMGHIGLTPQTATALGGLRAQGKTAEKAARLAEEAISLQAAGCFAIVFEAVPAAVTEAIVARLRVPTIGIGAGPSTSGQVLVLHDILGIGTGQRARFVKRFADVQDEMVRGLRAYTDEVRSGEFPGPDHIYSVEPAELADLNRFLEDDTLNSQAAWDWEPLS